MVLSLLSSQHCVTCKQNNEPVLSSMCNVHCALTRAGGDGSVYGDGVQRPVGARWDIPTDGDKHMQEVRDPTCQANGY